MEAISVNPTKDSQTNIEITTCSAISNSQNKETLNNKKKDGTKK